MSGPNATGIKIGQIENFQELMRESDNLIIRGEDIPKRLSVDIDLDNTTHGVKRNGCPKTVWDPVLRVRVEDSRRPSDNPNSSETIQLGTHDEALEKQQVNTPVEQESEPPEPLVAQIEEIFPKDSAVINEAAFNDLLNENPTLISDFVGMLDTHEDSIRSGEFTVTIEGHTSRDGSAEYNQGLSELRAQAFKDAIFERAAQEELLSPEKAELYSNATRVIGKGETEANQDVEDANDRKAVLKVERNPDFVTEPEQEFTIGTSFDVSQDNMTVEEDFYGVHFGKDLENSSLNIKLDLGLDGSQYSSQVANFAFDIDDNGRNVSLVNLNFNGSRDPNEMNMAINDMHFYILAKDGENVETTLNNIRGGMQEVTVSVGGKDQLTFRIPDSVDPSRLNIASINEDGMFSPQIALQNFEPGQHQYFQENAVTMAQDALEDASYKLAHNDSYTIEDFRNDVDQILKPFEQVAGLDTQSLRQNLLDVNQDALVDGGFMLQLAVDNPEFFADIDLGDPNGASNALASALDVKDPEHQIEASLSSLKPIVPGMN